MSFLTKLKNKWDKGLFVGVGLDTSDFALLQKVIDQTCESVCSYKINSAFFESEGAKGWEVLKETIQYIQKKDPQIPIILDAKRGDIEHTNEEYVKGVFDDLGVDGVTVHPYLGQESLQPFLKRTDKGIFVLVKTSNPGAGEFQDLEVYDPEQSRGVGGRPLYQVVAEHAKSWGENVGVVVGATYQQELKKIREIVADLPILIPGLGAQGGDLKATVQAGKNSQGQGIIISSSRGIIFADNPKEATLKLHQQIQEALNYG